MRDSPTTLAPLETHLGCCPDNNPDDHGPQLKDDPKDARLTGRAGQEEHFFTLRNKL